MTKERSKSTHFRLDDVVHIKTPNDCKVCERRVTTYLENVKDWQRQYDELSAKLTDCERRLAIARSGLERAAKTQGGYEAELRDVIDETINQIHQRCACGGVILADTEDWKSPLCNSCYEDLGQPATDPEQIDEAQSGEG